MKDLVAILNSAGIIRDGLGSIPILLYELGDLAKCLTYSRTRHDQRLVSVYLKEAELAMADLITQAKLICQQQAWDFENLMSLGEQRFIERMSELKNGVI